MLPNWLADSPQSSRSAVSPSSPGAATLARRYDENSTPPATDLYPLRFLAANAEAETRIGNGLRGGMNFGNWETEVDLGAEQQVVIIQPQDSGSKSHPFPHALVAGIERYPSKVTRRMSKARQTKRSKVKPFIKTVNYNHLMPTRYTLELEGLKGVVTNDTFKEVSQREEAKKTVKKALEERYQSGKNRWFFTPLRTSIPIRRRVAGSWKESEILIRLAGEQVSRRLVSLGYVALRWDTAFLNDPASKRCSWISSKKQSKFPYCIGS